MFRHYINGIMWILLKTVPFLIAQEDIIYIGNVEKFQQRQ